jgi:hypothetical protein
MALQGSLRDFSATEILQLLGTQKKTGCLMLEHGSAKATVFVQEGRVVSTRMPGAAKDDPLLAFLRKVHRLSDEQLRGVLTIQRESGRDIEDLLLNGRYLSEDELGQCLERQVVGDLEQLTRWDQGSYRFDPHTRWTQPAIVRIAVEGLIMESARRADERKRYAQAFPDVHLLLSVRDLPDPADELSDEERELFGIIDGRHTLAEIVAAAPLTEFEALEALHRMLEAGWIEKGGRRAPGVVEMPAAAPGPALAPPTPRSLVRELVVVAAVIVALMGLRLGARTLQPGPPQAGTESQDVYAAEQMRDLRLALDLYRREHGAYPAHLDQLIESRWLSTGQTRIEGFVLHYHTERGGADYRLELQPDR